ncbi:MAG: universal stress protein, partial [Deltaproteobacteria bacterium]|nr:universal stress protein [Deltaproteobacteria bacterium]
MREEHSIFREEMLFQPQIEDNVMVAITNPYTSTPLIRAGAKLVKPQGGRLIVLHVLTMSERSPQKLKQFKAQQQLQAMEEYVQRARIDKDILVIPFVRVSKDAALGIIDTTREEKVDLLLLGWEESEKQQVLERVWERAFDEAGEAQKQDSQESGNFDPLLDRIVRTVSCDIVIMQGQLPNKVERVLVPVGGSSHTSRTLGLGQRLVKDNKGQVVALHVTPAASTPRRKTGS